MADCNKLTTIFYIMISTIVLFIISYILSSLNTNTYPENLPCKTVEEYLYPNNQTIIQKDFFNWYHHNVILENLKNQVYGNIQEKCPKFSWSSETELLIDYNLIASTTYYLLNLRTYISDCHNVPLFYLKQVYSANNKFTNYQYLEEVYNANNDLLIGYILTKSLYFNENRTYTFIDKNDVVVAEVSNKNIFFDKWGVDIFEPTNELADLRLIYLASLQHYFNKIKDSDWCNDISIWVNIIFYIWSAIGLIWIIYIIYTLCSGEKDESIQFPIENKEPLIDKKYRKMNYENDQ